MIAPKRTDRPRGSLNPKLVFKNATRVSPAANAGVGREQVFRWPVFLTSAVHKFQLR
jgi:hypothetical protein